MSSYRNTGWVRLYRKIEDNFLYFLEPFTKAQAWIDIFLNANHKPRAIQIRGNIITLKRGQLGWSEITMSERWKWSRNKVRRFLKLLETEQQIEQQKYKHITTVITILNYDKLQNDTTDDTTEKQQKDNRRYINNNDKNDKNVNKGFSKRKPPLNVDNSVGYSPKGLPDTVKEILKAEGVKHVDTSQKGVLCDT